MRESAVLWILVAALMLASCAETTAYETTPGRGAHPGWRGDAEASPPSGVVSPGTAGQQKQPQSRQVGTAPHQTVFYSQELPPAANSAATEPMGQPADSATAATPA